MQRLYAVQKEGYNIMYKFQDRYIQTVVALHARPPPSLIERVFEVREEVDENGSTLTYRRAKWDSGVISFFSYGAGHSISYMGLDESVVPWDQADERETNSGDDISAITIDKTPASKELLRLLGIAGAKE